MAPSPDMQTLAARLATFEGPKQVAKRRASSNTKKKQANSVSWPHNSPSPEELAEAGFFYKPTADSHDSVTCYLCGKSLDGWEEGDNPAKEHLSHVPGCGWAANVCIGQRREDEDRAEDDPLSEQMIDARIATFGDHWPHESKKGWKPKVKKMVEAGWCYSPLPEYDDCVMCFYCGTSLDGWEPKDDPAKEHKKRAEDCHFFTLVEESKKLRKGKGKKTARGSKASRASTMTVDSEQVSFAATDLNDPAVEGESMLSTASTASRATRGRSRTAKGRITRTTRAAKEESFLDPPHAESSVEQLIADDIQPAAKRGHAKPETVQKAETPAIDSDGPALEPEPEPKKAPARKRATKKAAADNSTVDPETSMMSTQTETRATRGRKRASDGEEKLNDSIAVVDEKPASRPGTKAKGKRTASKKQQPSVEEPIDEEPRVEAPPKSPVEPVTVIDENPKQAKRKPAGRKKASADQKMVAPIIHQEMTMPQDEESGAPAPTVTSPARPAPKAADVLSPSAQSSDAENVPPSSRPSTSKRAPLSSIQDPNQAIATPQASPSKRTNTIGGLASTAPWTQIDLDAVLLPSPTSAATWAPQQLKLDQVLSSMTSPEKGMTVEQWILHNASRAEAALRDECERMIVQFEDEGNRAVRAVEGIQDCA